jgi:hypothetical protein
MTKQRPTPHARRNPLARTLGTLVLLALASSAQATSPPAAPELPAVQQALAGLAVPFEQNTGQFEPQVAYLARTFAGAVFVTRDGRLVYSLPGKAVETETDDAATESRLARRQRPPERGPGWALEERLLDARPLAPQGTVPAVTHVTRFTPKGTFQAETWQGVRLGEAWAGIEVELAARGRNFEKLFHVAPGANPEKIRIGLRGAEGAHVAADGRLIVATGNGEIAYTAPVAWQEIGGERHPVAARYALLAPEAGASESAYGFALGAYDRAHPLTIDPLIQSTYLGGNGYDYLNALALAANGDVLVGGRTTSTVFPGTAGAAQPAYGGACDGFVARLSGDLTELQQSTYLGGSNWDEIHALAPAANGDVVVGGWSNSTNLPGTAGGAQPSHGGYQDGFVARLSGDLRAAGPQTITFPPQADQPFVASGTFAIDPEATASSGLPVSYASGTPAVCTVSGSTVTMVTPGTCTLVASQAGDIHWEPAPDVSQSLELIEAQAQTITFPPQADQPFVASGTFAIDPEATAISGLPVSYASGTPAVCTVGGSTVTMVTPGTCTLVASQAGDIHWEPAPDVSQSLELRESVLAIPTLSPWTLALLALLLGGLGLRALGLRS